MAAFAVSIIHVFPRRFLLIYLRTEKPSIKKANRLTHYFPFHWQACQFSQAYLKKFLFSSLSQIFVMYHYDDNKLILKIYFKKEFLAKLEFIVCIVVICGLYSKTCLIQYYRQFNSFVFNFEQVLIYHHYRSQIFR